MSSDDYSPRWVGDVSHPLEHTFVDGNGKTHDLTGVVAANMTFVMKDAESGVRKVGAGSWTIGPLDPADPLPQGKAVYHWAVGDVNTAGLWQIQAGVPFQDGLLHFQIKEIEFKTPL